MELAFLTADEVKFDSAGRWAHDCGVSPHAVSSRDTPPDGRFDAGLYDLDGLPALRRLAVLTELLQGPRTRPVAVQSYDLDEAMATPHRARGVLVSRRLEPELLRVLVQGTRPNRAAIPPDGSIIRSVTSAP